MSRAYRIRVRESIRRDLSASDEISCDLELLEILPPEQMRELLRQELQGRGFELQPDGKLSRQQNGVTITVDPEQGTVSVKAEASESVELESQREELGYDDFGPSEEQIRQRLQQTLNQELERRAEQHRARLQTKATEQLEGELADVQKELNQAVNRVTAEALKRKAASLGQIKEITEDPEQGSLTITVEV